MRDPPKPSSLAPRKTEPHGRLRDHSLWPHGRLAPPPRLLRCDPPRRTACLRAVRGPLRPSGQLSALSKFKKPHKNTIVVAVVVDATVFLFFSSSSHHDRRKHDNAPSPRKAGCTQYREPQGAELIRRFWHHRRRPLPRQALCIPYKRGQEDAGSAHPDGHPMRRSRYSRIRPRKEPLPPPRCTDL